MRRTLKALSALLTYPTAELVAAIPELREALVREATLPPPRLDRLQRIMDEIADGDLYDLQERYVLLFDRTRSLSLHLFEHVHGESRDRGQAMVDLAGLYARHGYAVATTELPDYLPLLLEVASLLPDADARELLADTSHLMEALRLRLKKRKSAYSSVLSAVMALGEATTSTDLEARIAGEPDDDPSDLAALDRAWHDEEVRFGPSAEACGTGDLATRIRAGRRPADPVSVARRRSPIVTVNGSPRT